jgi:hypothetical protein
MAKADRNEIPAAMVEAAAEAAMTVNATARARSLRGL